MSPKHLQTELVSFHLSEHINGLRFGLNEWLSDACQLNSRSKLDDHMRASFCGSHVRTEALQESE